MIGAPIEDTISIMHLIMHGIPGPNIKIINSHLGGAMPMLLQRADDQYRWEAPDTPQPPSMAARRMWYDTVGHGHLPALRCAIDSFGADRLLLGTDFPYETGTPSSARSTTSTTPTSAPATPRRSSTQRQRPARHPVTRAGHKPPVAAPMRTG
jgi:6-methylsalicylate decarboxylase